MAARLTDQLTAEMSAAYTQSYISGAKETPGLPVSDGTRVTNIPKYTGDLSLTYESMLRDDYKFKFRVAEAYVGPVEDTAYYRETLPSHGLLDFRMGVGKGVWTASLFGTNLTDNTRR